MRPYDSLTRHIRGSGEVNVCVVRIFGTDSKFPQNLILFPQRPKAADLGNPVPHLLVFSYPSENNEGSRTKEKHAKKALKDSVLATT